MQDIRSDDTGNTQLIYGDNSKSSLHFKVLIKNRNYTEYEIVCKSDDAHADNESMKRSALLGEDYPICNKLFNEDEVMISKEKTVLIHSPTRESVMAGVLLLDRNYGSQGNKTLYKCVPNDSKLPIFLVPYEIKNTTFEKTVKKIYVLFKFCNWINKHPIGSIDVLIGSISVLKNYYVYQLYCRKLYRSINAFKKVAVDNMRFRNMHQSSSLEIINSISSKYDIDLIRGNPYIFSIDPENCSEFDDAVSVEGNKICVYITNVAVILHYFDLLGNIDITSNIYIPDKVKHMLPTVIGVDLCSLVQNSERIAMVVEFRITSDYIEHVEFSIKRIKISRNYRYDEQALIECKHYKKLKAMVNRISSEEVTNSKDLVEFLMIFTNYYASRKMTNGIFRNSEEKYSLVSKPHTTLKLPSYTHITSPLRRVVDIVNSFLLYETIGLNLMDENVITFCNKWMNELEYVNEEQRRIRKYSSECVLLNMYCKNPEIMEKEWHANVLYVNENEINVYIKNLGLYCFIKREQVMTANESMLACKSDDSALEKECLIKGGEDIITFTSSILRAEFLKSSSDDKKDDKEVIAVVENDMIVVKLVYFFNETKFKQKIRCMYLRHA